MPRPQVRPDLAERLLPAVRVLQPDPQRARVRVELWPRGAVRQGAAAGATEAAGRARRNARGAVSRVGGVAGQAAWRSRSARLDTDARLGLSSRRRGVE